MRRILGAFIGLTLVAGVAVAVPAVGRETSAEQATSAEPIRHLEVLDAFQAEAGADGTSLIRIMAGAFDPLDGLPPVPAAIPMVDPETLDADVPTYWFVQTRGDLAATKAAIEAAGAAIDGFLPDSAYLVRATPTQAAALAGDQTDAVRSVVLYQPGWKVPTAVGGYQGLLEVEGIQTYRVRVFDTAPEAAATATRAAIAKLAGAEVVDHADRVIIVRATAAQLPAIAALRSVGWIELEGELVALNANARWVTDTGIRDLQSAMTPGRLTGAGQTAGVADTDVSYVPDFQSGAQSYFRDCTSADGRTGCKVADYTQAVPGDEQVLATVDHGTDHRKMAAYFDIGNTGGISGDYSTHGTHVAGSVTGDTDTYGTWDREDGMAPGARLVHQNIGSPTGGLVTPPSDYDLWRQAYRPRNPESVEAAYDADCDFDADDPEDPDDTPGPCDYDSYVPTEDARTHNNSYGLVAPVVSLGNAEAADRFVWEHEDMFIVSSAGNDGPGAGTIGAPSIGRNVVTSGASANGRQPMASIDSMAIFSSHGPAADGAFGVDLVTPGQIVISPKGGTDDEEHYLQGTSMSGPILTGLATLVRQYFWDGYGPAAGEGVAGGAPSAARRHNPSAALVRATMVNGAQRMRGWYTGSDGADRALDGEYPSAGQGFGLVNLDRSLFFDDAQGRSGQALWVRDVWRGDEDAFDVGLGETRTYEIDVAAGQPLDVTLAFTDAPSGLPAGSTTRVNNLDLVVTAPDGTQYWGNNFNSQLDPSVDVHETIADAAKPDSVNPVEKVRVAEPVAGTWQVEVIGEQVAMGRQGFALAATGAVSEPGGAAFVPGAPLQQDAPGAPAITDVHVTSVNSDLARVTWTTSEPTVGEVTAVVGGASRSYVDSYNLSNEPGPDGEPGYYGMEEAPVETSAQYGDKPVVSTSHEVLVTGLSPGTPYSFAVSSTDLAETKTTTTVPFSSVEGVYGAQPFDLAQLTEAPTDQVAASEPVTGIGDGAFGTSTQMYAGASTDATGRHRLLGAMMFRAPMSLDVSRIRGAAVELTSAHDITNHYADDIRLYADLLPQEMEEEATWRGQNYTTVHEAPAVARARPETGYRRGNQRTYPFSFTCNDLERLKESLAAPTEGERRAAFRFDADTLEDTSALSAELGFNRRSQGAHLRPRLVLFLDDGSGGVVDPRPCDLETPAPTIDDLGIQPGLTDGSVTVSWRTDVRSDSTVLFREKGSTADFTQVGSDSLTTAHAVQVLGLDPAKDYEFGVRSAGCNGNATTDDNQGAGYNLFPDPKPVIPTNQLWFHGGPDDQLNKDNATFDATPPEGEGGSQQAITNAANTDVAKNALTAYWTGPYNGTIDGDMTLRWWWSSTNAAAIASGVAVEVTVFADLDDATPDDDTDNIIGRQEVSLDVGPAPVENVSVVRIEDAAVAREIVVQVGAIFVDTGNDVFVHYDAESTPSGFTVPAGTPVEAPPPPPEPQPGDPIAGPFGFETDEEGWTVATEDRNGPLPNNTWERGAPGHESEFSFGVGEDPGYMPDSDTTLTSPELTSVGGEAVVTWWSRYFTEAGFDEIRLEWSQNGTSWTRVGPTLSDINPSYPEWDPYEARFGVPAGPFRIRYLFTSDSNATFVGARIDDVLVSQVPGPVAEPAPEEEEEETPDAGPGIVSAEIDRKEGPVPPPSAGSSISLASVATRRAPSPADLAAGTARCFAFAGAPTGGDPGDRGVEGSDPLPPPGPPPPTPAAPGQGGGSGGTQVLGEAVARGRGPASACDPAYVPDGDFDDLVGNVHAGNIRCIAWYAITRGRTARSFEPDGTVTRGQMASFLARLLLESGVPLPAGAPDRFEDDDGNVHEANINALAQLGLIQGKGDRDGDGREEFDPAAPVQRDQAASLVARLHRRVTGSLPESPPNRFEDDEGNTHEQNINAMAQLGVVLGKGDRDRDGRDEYDPLGWLTRGQAASLVVRELGLLVSAEKAEPGGAVVFLDSNPVPPGGGPVAGSVRTGKEITGLVADGCGLTDQAVAVAADRTFSVTIPAGRPAGECELTLTVSTRRAGEEAATQEVPWSFDVTIRAA